LFHKLELARLKGAADVVARLEPLQRPITRALAREVVEGARESGDLFE
jgi:hypothetical protein